MSDIPGNNYNKLQIQDQLDPWNSSLEKPDYETNFKFHDCYRSQGNVKWWGMAKGVDSATGKGVGGGSYHGESNIRHKDFRTSSSVLPCVTLRPPPLDSETGWTGELWSKTNLLNWQN